MSEWTTQKISDVYEGLYDGPHATPPDSENGAVFLGISNITPEGRLDLSEIKHISEYDLPKWTKRVVPRGGDIVFSYEATLNLYAIIPEGFWGCLGRRMALIRPNNDKAYGKFLYYYFFSPQWRATVQENTVVGATVDRIPIARFPDFPVSIPDLYTQHKIADFLSAYDDLIETNQRQIKLLEEAAQRLYKEWFVDLRYPGHENVPVVDGVPEGWEKRSLLLESTILRRGISPVYNDNGNYTVINQKCIRSAIMDIKESRRQEKEYPEELNLQDGDTVICSTGIGTLGRVGQVFGEYSDTTFDSHVTLVRAKQYPHYHYHTIKSQEDYLMGMGRGSTNQQELYRNVIESLDVYIPTEEVLNRAEAMFAKIHEKTTALKDENIRLIEARDRLLPKLMSGEIAV